MSIFLSVCLSVTSAVSGFEELGCEKLISVTLFSIIIKRGEIRKNKSSIYFTNQLHLLLWFFLFLPPVCLLFHFHSSSSLVEFLLWNGGKIPGHVRSGRSTHRKFYRFLRLSWCSQVNCWYYWWRRNDFIFDLISSRFPLFFKLICCFHYKADLMND